MQNKWHEHSVGNIVVNFPLSPYSVLRASTTVAAVGVCSAKSSRNSALSTAIFIKRWMSLPPVRKSPLSLFPK